MYVPLLQDARFYEFLLHVDRDLAEQARRAGCRVCGASLHSACYARSPRGLPEGVDAGRGFELCYSFCCSADGCRRRHRAPSVRFLDRKVYLSVMVLLLTAMRQGPTPRATRELKGLFGADRRTLARWQRSWQAIFPHTEFWRRARGLFPMSIREDKLPSSIIAQFMGRGLVDGVVRLLRFFSSMSSGSSKCAAF